MWRDGGGCEPNSPRSFGCSPQSDRLIGAPGRRSHGQHEAQMPGRSSLKWSFVLLKDKEGFPLQVMQALWEVLGGACGVKASI